MELDCSIIIPVYNAGLSIKEVLNSIQLDKTWKHQVEVIIVDDGSTDNTLLSLQYYFDNYHEIQVVHQNNAGVSTARNTGLSIAKGRYVFFVDSDDVMRRSIMEKMITLADDLELDIVIADYRMVDYKNDYQEEICCGIPYNRVLGQDYLNTVFRRFFIDDTAGLSNVWSKLYRREIISKNNLLFDEMRTQGEDWSFCISFFQHTNRMYAIEDISYEYHLDGSQSRSKYKKELAYCLLDGNQIAKSLNDLYLHYSEDSYEYLEYMKSFYYQIISFLKLEDNHTKRMKFLKEKSVKKCFSYLRSLDDDMLLMADFSKKDRVAFNLLLLGLYKPVLKCIL